MTYVVEGKTFGNYKKAEQYARAISIEESRGVKIERVPIPYKTTKIILVL